MLLKVGYKKTAVNTVVNETIWHNLNYLQSQWSPSYIYKRHDEADFTANIKLILPNLDPTSIGHCQKHKTSSPGTLTPIK